MPIEEQVFIAGAGPVGLVAAANLLRRGVPVTVFEAGAVLSEESRASTFHPSTLDMLDEFGAAGPLIAQGLIAPQVQYRTRDGVIATFDFGAIADATRHPFRLQAEQFKLTRILHERLNGNPGFRIEFGVNVANVEQDDAAGILRLHLARALSGRLDAIRFSRGHRGNGFRHLCGRSAALALSPGNSGWHLAGDVSADRDLQR
ncbi:MAG: FAD-dependent oxidoreductase [Xanthobacteraceae bacterium]